MKIKSKKNAIFSPCRKYRYVLWRIWNDSKPFVMFIGFNPSKADEVNDDPTITRCINFSKFWGYGGMYVTNLFALRTTKPKIIRAYKKPIGKYNDNWIKVISKKTETIIAAWGNNGSYLNRSKIVEGHLPNLKCIKKNLSGFPSHPLYLRSNLKPFPLDNK